MLTGCALILPHCELHTMANCQRCEEELSDQRGTFWDEPILLCPRCGSRHRRESQGDRMMELAVVAPFAIATLAGWCAVGFLLCRLIRKLLWAPKWILAFLSLAALCALATRHLVTAIKGISAPREVSSLAK